MMKVKIANVAAPVENQAFNPLAFNENPNHDELGRFAAGDSVRRIQER
jgi:hypothetical protein